MGVWSHWNTLNNHILAVPIADFVVRSEQFGSAKRSFQGYAVSIEDGKSQPRLLLAPLGKRQREWHL
jgi:hypothetical protein